MKSVRPSVAFTIWDKVMDADPRKANILGELSYSSFLCTLKLAHSEANVKSYRGLDCPQTLGEEFSHLRILFSIKRKRCSTQGH